MKKKIVGILLTAAVAAGTLAGCGSRNPSGSQTSGSVDPDSGEGAVINIYSFNDELRNRITAVYPEIAETSEDGTTSTLIDGTVINWIINPNQDGVYQN